MGLQERRKIKELEDTVLPGPVKEIEEIWGCRYALGASGMHSDGDIRQALFKKL